MEKNTEEEFSFVGMRCPRCGSKLTWQNDYSGNDINDEMYPDPEADAIVTDYSCPTCGGTATFYDCSLDERSAYDYWNGDKQTEVESNTEQ